MSLRYCWFLAAVAFLTGCGKEEHGEAVAFCKVLEQKRADLASANKLEKDFLDSVRAWSDGLMANGGGRAADLEQNAGVAKDLANSAATLSTQLGQVREAVENMALKKEYLQNIRTGLINKLSKRQRLLTEVRAALLQSAAGFEEFRQSRAYAGDTYPSGIDKLNPLVQGYKGPEDSVAQAIADLKTKYKIQDADLAP
ncbi:MAG: hypothetical protein LAP87_04835 [Acidobacteriia bacterium]|nr:hypothetical protein [Terriglobia bacterium]